MDKLANIDSVLEKEFKCNSSCLEEKTVSMKIDVDTQRCRSIIYQFDKQLPKAYKGGLFPFLAKNEGVCKMCDYIIFAEKNSKIYALVLELKRGKSQTLPQLNAAECLAKYINLTYNRVHKTNEKFIVRKISVKEINIRKKRTKMSEVEYDEHNHFHVDTNKFYIVAYLK